jgi:NAD(P)H-nitrite reductase large subunit
MAKKRGSDFIICRCEEVTHQEIIQAFRSGADTVDAIKRRTRAGMGLCQGRTCRRLVSRIVAKQKKEGLGEQRPPSFRPPVRPIRLGLLK